MNDEFFRFPQTPHIAWLGQGAPRDDKLMAPDEVQALLEGSVVVEEKLDGANLGFSSGLGGALRVQNRGQYLAPPYSGQFQRLTGWLAMHGEALMGALEKHLIIFGEWCAARHSVAYPRLPDWWLMFDVYDRHEARFWSSRRCNALAEKLRVTSTPRVATGHHTRESLEQLVAESGSRYGDGPLEGVVVRRENADWLLARGKLVRPDFTQAIEGHWRSHRLEWNRIAPPESAAQARYNA